MNPPCLLFEDDHLLVVNKPAGLNTHSPGPFAGEGLYDWLRHREPRWAGLAIIHRLDKETSGVLVFSKTPQANRSLTEQFTERLVKKKYLLLTDHAAPSTKIVVRSSLVRSGDRYLSRPPKTGGQLAETVFSPAPPGVPASRHAICVQAEPLTGRTHQIRVHAAEKSFPVLGDVRYGGTPWPRICLHAAEISFVHPSTGQPLVFRAEPDFDSDIGLALRSALIDETDTNAYRLIHGASDGCPGWYVDRLGSFILSQSSAELTPERHARLRRLADHFSARGVYHKTLAVGPLRHDKQASSPRLVLGSSAPARFDILENGVRFQLSFEEGYSVGIFLDQRGNRMRLSKGHVSAGFDELFDPARPTRVLNAFAYTCAFSVCAARSACHATSLDLSKKYLQWGKDNFKENHLDASLHDFIFGDVFDWLRRFQKKGRKFDLILLDPPTFSHSKEFGAFRVDKDFGKLAQAALPLLESGGVLFASCNAALWPAQDFVATLRTACGKRKVLREHYAPQPPDFPISRDEPAYFKSYWARLV
ncbi:MAG TPA: pseudouridine synthase [Verrucomicrobiae bacterium]|nr:pseudouridine synthase [Verrucomicrobiae bacterium]